MQHLVSVIGGLMILAALALFTVEPIAVSNELSVARRSSPLDIQWFFGAMLWTPLTKRDWIATLAVLAFVGANIYLWSLPLSQPQLFYITAPLGVAALLAFLWLAPRD